MAAKRVCPWAEGIFNASHAPDSCIQHPRKSSRSNGALSRALPSCVMALGVESGHAALGYGRWFPQAILKRLGSSGVDRVKL
jgi:hypothetical protein